MIELTARFAVTDKVHWHLSGGENEHDNNELNVSFYYYEKLKRREALVKVKANIEQNGIEWLIFREGRWVLKSELLKNEFNDLRDVHWLRGNITVDPEVETEEDEVFGVPSDTTRVSFLLSKEYVDMTAPNKIFLSHKGVDKPYVREFSSILEELGFTPWLDEDALVAGVGIERAILQGFKDSCAAVFFITPSFKDEDYLATEIEYAIHEKREKGDRFAIITLVFKDNQGQTGQVPPLLKGYKWKEPKSQIEALRELLKAIPIKVGPVQWRS